MQNQNALALQVFNYKGNTVCTVEIDGEPWFVAKDVCDILELTNPTEALKSLDNDEKNTLRISEGIQGRGNPNMNVISEPGLYKLAFKSKKPEAKNFVRWVSHEVLPSIRKYGAYLTPQKQEELIQNPDFIIRLAQELKAERIKVKALQEQNEKDRPKVIFAEAVDASQSSILIGNLAKILQQNGVPDMGEKRLFAWLRDNGYLCRCKGERWNMPTQGSLEKGLFEVKKVVINAPDGTTKITHTTKVTGKGQIFFVNVFLTMGKYLL